MKAIKALVIFMTLLIIVGLAVLAYGVTTKFGGKTETPSPPLAATGVTALALGEPEGTTILSTMVNGGSLALTLDGGGKGQRVVIIDLTGGQVTATVTLGN